MKEVRNHYGFPMLERLDKEDGPAVHAFYVVAGVLVLAALGYIGWSSVLRGVS